MKTWNVCIALAVISAAACGGSGGSYSTSPTTNQPNGPSGNTTPPPGAVSVTNNAFSPATTTIDVGATVTWTWNTCSGDIYSGQICSPHSVTFDDGSTSSVTLDQGSFSRAFTTANKTYTYHCAVHGALMTGTITVR